jgi:putative transposase
MVSLKPNKHQKQVLNELIRLNNEKKYTKSEVELQERPTIIREGSFKVSKRSVRLLTENDTDDSEFRGKHIAIMVERFLLQDRETPKEFKFIKLSKNVDRLPPIETDLKIEKRLNGKFVLHIPCDSKYTRRSFTPKDAMCGVDPGSRSFATVYDPTEKTAYQVGTRKDKQRAIPELQRKIDMAKAALQRAIDKNHKQAIDERRAQLRKLQFKLDTYVSDVHLKLSSHLVRNYNYVAIGKLDQSTQDRMPWNHQRFREKLLHRAKGTACNVVIQDEAFTSKTCGVCGSRNKNLGSSETFRCDTCTYETHRDVNGARNILLKSRNMFPFEHSQ